MTPHQHARPVAHPRLETGIAVAALLFGLILDLPAAVASAFSRPAVRIVASLLLLAALIGVIVGLVKSRPTAPATTSVVQLADLTAVQR